MVELGAHLDAVVYNEAMSDRLSVWLIHPEEEMCSAFGDRSHGLGNIRVIQSRFEDLEPHDCFVTAGNAFGMMTAGIDAAVVRFFGEDLMLRVQHRIMDEFLWWMVPLMDEVPNAEFGDQRLTERLAVARPRQLLSHRRGMPLWSAATCRRVHLRYVSHYCGRVFLSRRRKSMQSVDKLPCDKNKRVVDLVV